MVGLKRRRPAIRLEAHLTNELRYQTIDYKALAQRSLDQRREIFVERQKVVDDPDLKNDEKRATLSRMDAEMDRLAETAGDYVREGERAQAISEMMERGGSALAANGLNTEARYGVALPAGKGFSDIVGVRAATDREFGEHVRALVYGDAETRANEGTDSAGGFLVPTTYAAGVLDLARNKSRVIQAGASVVPIETDDHRQAKVETDPTPAWRNESAAIATGAITFGEVNLKPKSLAVLVKASMELVEDAPNFGAVLQQSLAGAFAVTLDSASLYGSGTAPTPRGLKNTPGVTVTPLGATGAPLDSYDPFIAAVRDVRAANHTAGPIVLSERTEADLGSLRESANGQYLAVPPYLSNVPRLTSGNVPNNLTVGTSTDCSDAFAGAWEHLVIGVRSAFSLRVLSERFMDTGEFGFVATLRADVQVARNDAFQIVSGIRPAA